MTEPGIGNAEHSGTRSLGSPFPVLGFVILSFFFLLASCAEDPKATLKSQKPAAFLTVTSPVDGGVMDARKISYTLQGELKTALITWTQVEGPGYQGSTHTAMLQAADLTAGAHADVALNFISGAADLVHGSVYSVSFAGTLPPGSGPSDPTVIVENVSFATAPPVLVDAIWTDPDGNGVDAGDPITLGFDQRVKLHTANPEDFLRLPVPGDSFGLGASAAVAALPAPPRSVTVTLGTGPRLAVGGTYEPALHAPGSSSGIGLKVPLPANTLTNPSGFPALAADVPMDLTGPDPRLRVTGTWPLGGDTNAPVNRRVAVRFSEKLDATTVVTTGASPNVFPDGGGKTWTSSASYDPTGSILVLAPNGGRLTAGPGNANGYELVVKTSVKAMSGRSLPTAWHSAFTIDPGTLDNTAPTLLGTSAPASGATGVSIRPTIVLRFSEPMDPSSFTLGAGGSVQLKTTAGGAQALLDFAIDRGLSVVELVPKSDLTPTVSYTLELSAGIADLAGLAIAASSRSFTAGAVSDVDAPVVTLLTINRIPDVLNGKGAAGGTLAVPPTGFTIDLEYADTGGSGIDPRTLTVTANKALGGGAASGGFDAGENLAELFGATTTGASLRVAAFPGGKALGFPAGQTVTLEASIADSASVPNVSAKAGLTVQVVAFTDDKQPFESSQNGNVDIQKWYLVFSRDLSKIEFEPSASGDGTKGDTDSVTTNGPNGIPDFEEDLALFGLRSTAGAALPVQGTSKSCNQVVYELLVEEAIQQVHRCFGIARTYTTAGGGIDVRNLDSVNVAFVFTSPLPDWRDRNGNLATGVQTDYDALNGHSRIAVGGPDRGANQWGSGWFDTQNKHQDDDSRDPTAAIPKLQGSFTTEAFERNYGSAPSSDFRQAFDPLIPGRGQPLGSSPLNDHVVLAPAFDRAASTDFIANQRYDQLMTAIEAFARGIVASNVAHETGHSMGLMEDGTPPTGLFGAAAGPFPGSTSLHLQLPVEHFPYPAVPIMEPFRQPYGRFAVTSRFDELSLAYLRERVLVNK